ncbi:hypothetical protein AAFF_G00209770 [Aldrovandia affinis]|uniref:Uncharacterized protein n=1 Tax=Aldrovandia affinis TaxID=143900 RepID=A0AAD7SWC6_9TELE|nr:hypothetical protein AAFF_G00209770 [Aldrovandia affinis]
MPDGTTTVQVKDYKLAFKPLLRPVTGISGFRGAKFERGQAPLSHIAMTADCSNPFSTLKRGKKMSTLKLVKPPAAYTNFRPIKEAKYNDILALLTHVNLLQEVTFYNNLHGQGNAAEQEAGEAEDAEE